MLKIGIADDHEIFRKSFAEVFGSDDSAQMLVQAANGLELLRSLRTITLDLLFLDLEMPVLDGISTLSKLRLKYPEVKVLIISLAYDDFMLMQLVKNGASGFLKKDSAPAAIRKAVSSVMEKGYYFGDAKDPAIFLSLLENGPEMRPPAEEKNQEHPVIQDEMMAQLPHADPALKVLLRQFLTIQEAGQKRRAQELHHSVGGTLSALKLQVNLFSKKEQDKASIQSFGEESRELLSETVARVREICYDLYPTTLQKVGLFHALAEMTKEGNRSEGLQMDFVSNLENQSLGEELETAIFRMGKDLVESSLASRQTKHIGLEVMRQDKYCTISYSDDGIRQISELAEVEGEDWMISLRLRLWAFGGNMALVGEKEESKQIRIILPL